MFEKSKRVVLGAAITTSAAAAVTTTTTPASAAPAKEAEAHHCVTDVLSSDQLKRGEKNVITCFATFEQAMASRGYQVPSGVTDRLGSLTQADFSAMATNSETLKVLGYSYEHQNKGGYTFTQFGYSCDGTGTNFPGTWWDDKISSSRIQYCRAVKHFNSVDANGEPVGTGEVFEGDWDYWNNLSSGFDNQVSAVRYYPDWPYN